MKKYTNFFITDNELKPEQNYVEVLDKILGKTELQKKLFHHIFESKKMIFFIDGYDEISPTYSTFVLNLIKTIKLSGNSLLITTRQYLQSVLTSELGVYAIHLQFFNYHDQITFLVNFWSHKNLKSKKSLTAEAVALLEMIYKSLGLASLDFFGNPLMIKMLAEIFNDEDSYQTQEVQLNMFQLYEKFWEKKIDLLFEKGPLTKSDLLKTVSKVNVLGIHHKFAMETYFLKHLAFFLELPDLPQPFNDTCDIIRRLGFINPSMIGDSITSEWMHRSFVEYFAADYILANITQKNSAEKSKVLYLMFVEVLLHPQTGEIRKFINGKLKYENFKNRTNLLPKNFRKKILQKNEESIILLLIAEGHNAFLTFIMEALPENDIFDLLVVTGQMGNGTLSFFCSSPGNFAIMWPIFRTFLNRNLQKKLLLKSFKTIPN